MAAALYSICDPGGWNTVFGQRIRGARTAAGLTQQEIADRMTAAGLKMHQTAIAKIESGERPATVAEAMQLACILGVTAAELVTDPPARTHEEQQARQRHAEVLVEIQFLQLDAVFRQQRLDEAQEHCRDVEDRLSAARERLAEIRASWPVGRS